MTYCEVYPHLSQLRLLLALSHSQTSLNPPFRHSLDSGPDKSYGRTTDVADGLVQMAHARTYLGLNAVGNTSTVGRAQYAYLMET